ncbi:MAG: OmpA family protein [Bacteroidia bacterium]
MLKKLLVFVLYFFALTAVLNAQQNIKKATKYYKKAYTFYGYGQYEKSHEWAQKALEKDSLNQNTLVLLTDIYNIQGLFDKELKVYKKLLRIDSTDIRSHANMADIYLKTGEFEKAFAKYAFLKSANWLPERYDKLINKNFNKSTKAVELIENPKDFKREKLKGDVNSELDEYWPYMTPDGKKLFFTRTSLTQLKENLRKEENIHFTKWKNNSWANETKLPEAINTIENEGAQCITQDGKTMFFTVCKTTLGNQGDCNIYMSQLQNRKWSVPTMLPAPVNTRFKETQPSISYDGRTLFFSSDRPGGQGGMDIWATRMNDDSLWANPKNISIINTKQNEESPFIHPDNKTLYFSSTGHYGLGKGDFFMVKLNKNGTVKNLGYPLNNHEMQLGIYIDLDGVYGYYASVDPETNSSLDIYRFTLPDDIKPEPLKIINGILIDSKTQQPINNGNIVVFNLANNEHVVSYTTQQDGTFKFGLPANTKFAILAEANGYLPYSIHSSVDLNGIDSLVKIALDPITANKTFALQNIFFDFDSASLKLVSATEIAYLAGFLDKYPKVIIEIGGHTDNVGNDAYNMTLSEERAMAVFNALKELMGQNIKERVKVKGYGKTAPIATNNTEFGRQKNRRTEIKIISLD